MSSPIVLSLGSTGLLLRPLGLGGLILGGHEGGGRRETEWMGRASRGLGHKSEPGLQQYLLLPHGGDDCPHVIAAWELKGRHHLGPDALLRGGWGIQITQGTGYWVPLHRPTYSTHRTQDTSPSYLTCSTDRAPFFP